MGAIKLIDLDQEIFVPIYDEAQGMTYEQIMTIGEMFDKFMGGYQPHVVDAIPVEWLTAQIKSYTGDVSDIGKSVRNGTIKELIRKWQNEQEARM